MLNLWDLLGEGISVDGRGHLRVGGCDTLELAARFGTPLYAYDEEGIRRRCRDWKEAVAALWPDGQVLYASKAFLTLAMAALIEEEGLGLDVCSGGELWTALEAGFPAERVYFQGNGKSWEELEMALQVGVGRIVVDNPEELGRLHLLGARLGKKASVLLRVTPGVDAGAHDHISTGKYAAKFGFLPGDQLREGVSKAGLSPYLELAGLACHVGSQILDPAPLSQAAEAMVEVARAFPWSEGWELDLGGGLGARYTREDDPPSPRKVVAEVVERLREGCRKWGLPLPRLLFEPGRSLVAEAAVALYTVNAVKEMPGRRYVVVDGGIHDNPRPPLYGARYTAALAGRMADPPEGEFWVVGKNCESSDVLAREVLLPWPRPGEIVAIFTAGAYQYAMASNYNRFPRPAVIFAREGTADLVVARESYHDLLARDLLPARLRRAHVAATASS